ncbi:hypothetical protein Anas_03805 [Armadillidium nasatum]|uniref:Uncharacterized protein n=1 Tax=Armadillidium nasatum TaxID=96803 RepID=A0A5N5TIC3_9CRUS|nr:hypothetical protein Anas_03805 [Armadillidium nasatum]
MALYNIMHFPKRASLIVLLVHRKRKICTEGLDPIIKKFIICRLSIYIWYQWREVLHCCDILPYPDDDSSFRPTSPYIVAVVYASQLFEDVSQ